MGTGFLPPSQWPVHWNSGTYDSQACTVQLIQGKLRKKKNDEILESVNMRNENSSTLYDSIVVVFLK